MKKQLIYFVAILLGLGTLTSCQKDPASDLAGTYTYKTSGTVTVQPKEDYTGEESTFTFDLVNEEGQMTLVKQGEKQLLVACNAVAGDAYTYTVVVDDDGQVQTEGQPHKSISVKPLSLPIGHGDVRFDADGKLYDDVLVFSCQYSGTITIAGFEMDIIESEVETVAKRN
ncbi:MAG: hypothetical protein K6A28_03800 [Bacteroidales bacterium]|nr:hypothetical protein [Bacteroidales bacterium]